MVTPPEVLLLVAVRQAAGLDVETVAARMGQSVAYVEAIELGTQDPRMSTIFRYARVVGASIRFEVGEQ